MDIISIDSTPRRAGSVYTLTGTRLEAVDIDALTAGMYIIDGKKIIAG